MNNLPERSQQPQHQNRPIFVMGYMHSGTTLLQQIMGRHPDVYVAAGETNHFRNLEVTKGRYPDLADDSTLRDYLIYVINVILRGYAVVNFHESERPLVVPAELGISEDAFDHLLQTARETRDHAALLPVVYDFLTHRAGKQRWLDKLPGYVSQYEQLLHYVPDAQFVELIRDPRDILASKRKRTRRGGSFDPLWDSLAWKSAVRAGGDAARRHPGLVLRVRYEDLVRDPAAEVRRICDFLGLSFAPDMLEVGWINTTSASEQREGIGTSAVGKWRRVLSPAAVALAQSVTRDEMAVMGYEPDAVTWRERVQFPLLFVRSGGEFFVRLVNRYRLGGLAYMRNVLRHYGSRLFSLRRRA